MSVAVAAPVIPPKFARTRYGPGSGGVRLTFTGSLPDVTSALAMVS